TPAPCAPVIFPRRRTRPRLHSFPTRRSSDLPPFIAETNSMSELKKIKSKPTHLLSFAPHASTATAFVLDKALSVKPEDRFSAYEDRKSTRLNSSHVETSYAVFCLKKKKWICP